MSEKEYVLHHCKNPKCNEGWTDKDLTNAKTNCPRWKYCDICCEKYGFVNPEFPPKKKDYKERIERLSSYKFDSISNPKKKEV